MSTELLYQTDSYLKEFSAKVTNILPEKNAIILDRTVFYPGGGGQTHDSGMIRFSGQSVQLIRSKYSPAGLIHILETGAILPETDTEVIGKLDWHKRYQLMRTHTAMHILCGVIFHQYGTWVTGGDMHPLRGRMDFEFERLQKELVSEIEASINEEMAKGHEVRIQILPREEAFKIPDLIRTKINLLPEGITEVRTVEIVGLDLQADGGTHVKNTTEVGPIRIPNYKSKGGINKRIYVELDT